MAAVSFSPSDEKGRELEVAESKQLMVEEKHEITLVSMAPELSVGFGCESALCEKGDGIFEQPSLQGQDNAGQWQPSVFCKFEPPVYSGPTWDLTCAQGIGVSQVWQWGKAPVGELRPLDGETVAVPRVDEKGAAVEGGWLSSRRLVDERNDLPSASGTSLKS